MIPGDWEKASYTYPHKVNGQWPEVHDHAPSEANSSTSFIIDPKKLLNTLSQAGQDPAGLPTKAVIYEMSVRDFSSQRMLVLKNLAHSERWQSLPSWQTQNWYANTC